MVRRGHTSLERGPLNSEWWKRWSLGWMARRGSTERRPFRAGAATGQGAQALAAHRPQAQEDEVARLRTLRAAGVEADCEYVAVDRGR